MAHYIFSVRRQFTESYPNSRWFRQYFKRVQSAKDIGKDIGNFTKNLCVRHMEALICWHHREFTKRYFRKDAIRMLFIIIEYMRDLSKNTKNYLLQKLHVRRHSLYILIFCDGNLHCLKI